MEQNFKLKMTLIEKIADYKRAETWEILEGTLDRDSKYLDRVIAPEQYGDRASFTNKMADLDREKAITMLRLAEELQDSQLKENQLNDLVTEIEEIDRSYGKKPHTNEKVRVTRRECFRRSVKLYQALLLSDAKIDDDPIKTYDNAVIAMGIVEYINAIVRRTEAENLFFEASESSTGESLYALKDSRNDFLLKELSRLTSLLGIGGQVSPES